MQNNRWLQALIVLLVIIASAWLAGQAWSFLIQFSNVILLFFLAWLLAFILSPIARAMQRRGVPKTLSVAVVYLSLALIFTGAGWFLVPAITDQISKLINNFNTYTSTIGQLVNQGNDTLHSWGMTKADLTSLYNEISRQINGVALTALQNTFGVLQSLATVALQFILVLLLSFYFMNDGDRIFGGMLQMLPPRWQDEARLVALSLEKSFGGFVRGQLVFALVYAILTAIVMMMPPFGLDFVIIASIVSGLCMIIPLIGNFLAFMPPILVCLVMPGKADLWWQLLLAEFIMQSLMMNLLGPRIMSSAIGIHPLYVVAAMLVGAQVAGFWGALFGIPIAGAVNLIGRPLMRRMRYQSSLYKESTAEALPTSAFLTGPLAISMAQQSGRRTGELAQDTQVLTGAAQALKGASSPIPTGALPATGTLQQAAMAPVPAVPSSSQTRQPPAQPQLPPELDPDQYMVPRSPTLTLRAWRLVFALATKARAWAGRRVQARVPRQ